MKTHRIALPSTKVKAFSTFFSRYSLVCSRAFNKAAAISAGFKTGLWPLNVGRILESSKQWATGKDCLTKAEQDDVLAAIPDIKAIISKKGNVIDQELLDLHVPLGRLEEQIVHKTMHVSRWRACLICHSEILSERKQLQDKALRETREKAAREAAAAANEHTESTNLWSQYRAAHYPQHRDIDKVHSKFTKNDQLKRVLRYLGYSGSVVKPFAGMTLRPTLISLLTDIEIPADRQ